MRPTVHRSVFFRHIGPESVSVAAISRQRKCGDAARRAVGEFVCFPELSDSVRGFLYSEIMFRSATATGIPAGAGHERKAAEKKGAKRQKKW